MVYQAMPWGSPRGVRTANCYAYSLDSYNESRLAKSQPGNVAARRRGFADRQAEALALGAPDSKELACSALTRKILDDHQHQIYVEDPQRPCRSGFYKIMLGVSTGKNSADLHFWKQHKDLVVDKEPGQTLASIASLYQVPLANVKCIGRQKVFVANAGVFSHKLGHATGALLTDSCGKPIFDPRKSCRKVGNRNYKVMCNSFCVKSQRGTGFVV